MGWSWIFDLLLTRSAPAGLSWAISWRALAGKPLSFQPGLVVGGSQKFKGKTHFAILFAGMRSGNPAHNAFLHHTACARAFCCCFFVGRHQKWAFYVKLECCDWLFLEKIDLLSIASYIFTTRWSRLKRKMLHFKWNVLFNFWSVLMGNINNFMNLEAF